jgi:hypothetical protein
MGITNIDSGFSIYKNIQCVADIFVSPTGEIETTRAVVIESITVNDTISMTGEIETTRAVVIESITVNDTISMTGEL